ncbi:Major facilitator superfamily domain general substrate transporter [Penicillium malachiteum]|uniref:Major facilitator superfamily domain general substrate transporter n=1 Tax=Penicillium malachiteum TaxID=1324776 RepID=UPI0025467120|nr:Major facilitator superfamily domain general substrate transporter [Penicillium malachiteum]KAJ5715646.1 Major facilitator superfamily domain general substrate transporter [Penicillium malachiteum]
MTNLNYGTHAGSEDPSESERQYSKTTNNEPIHDEESPLLPPSTPTDSNVADLTGVGTMIAVLLLGELVSNADATLVLACEGLISSEFDRLRDASWLSTGYSLGLCAVQPMYGKLSDIYGRKPLLIISYVLFAIGCIICGIASNMSIVILGRAIGGLGGAGTMVISSVIITDIVPKRDVATWRAYVNISMTLGRSIGGPLGGWLSDTIGWRWLFLVQAPFMALAAFLVFFMLPGHPETKSGKSKIQQVDFLGAGLLAAAIIALTGLMDQGGKSFAWNSVISYALSIGGIILLLGFIAVEAYVAKEPIFNLRILRRSNVGASYILSTLQVTAQLGMLFSVPLYFQVTQQASTTLAGIHLVPAVVGNTLGGLLAGIFIKKTGCYKPLLVAAGLIAAVSYALLYLKWDGQTGFWDSFYIIPGGFGTGIASAAAFIAMTATLPAEEVAMATAGYMMLISFAMTAGVTMSNSVLGIEFERELRQNLRGPGSERIIKRTIADAAYIAQLGGRLREIVLECFLGGLKHTYVVSFTCSLAAAFMGLFIQHHQL